MGLKDKDAPWFDTLSNSFAGIIPLKSDSLESVLDSSLTHLVELRLLSFNLPSQGLNCGSCLSQLTQQLLLLRLTLQVPWNWGRLR